MARTGRPKADKPFDHKVTVKFKEEEYQIMVEYADKSFIISLFSSAVHLLTPPLPFCELQVTDQTVVSMLCLFLLSRRNPQ